MTGAHPSRVPHSNGKTTSLQPFPASPSRDEDSMTDEPTGLLPITKAGRLSTKRLPRLTRDEAKRLTREAKVRGPMQWLQLERARDGKAHEALGYDTWKDYAAKELGMSESRTFQLLDTAKVMRAVAAGGAHVIDADPVPARVVAKVKSHLTEVEEVTRAAIAEDRDIQEAIRSLAQSVAPDSTRSAPRPTAQARPGEVPCPCCNGSGFLPEVTARLLAQTIGESRTVELGHSIPARPKSSARSSR